MDQLKALDDIFLDLETPEVQANIGGVSVFEGPKPDYEELLRRIESKLDSNPHYRQRLRFLPFRIGSPVWVDDERFDVRRHLMRRTLRAPGDAAALAELYARIVSQHLPRDRPLWQVYVVEGLADGRWALCWKVHHAMVDGIAATELFSLLLDAERDAVQLPPSSWVPRRGPHSLTLVGKTLISPDGPTKVIRDLAGAATRPRRTVGRGLVAARGFLPVAGALVSRHDSPLNGPIGSQRRWVTAEIDLKQVKQVSRHFGGTVNDVVVSASANGLRKLLLRHGEKLDNYDARTMIPVSIRHKRGHGEADNEISAVFIELPVAIDDPVERLHSVRVQMATHKHSHDDIAGETLLGLANYVPPTLFMFGERLTWRLGDTQRLMNTVTTNVPGPQLPLYCLGREMQKMYPYVMLPKNVRVATAIFSYNGRVYFGVTGDRTTVPDVKVVARGIEEELVGLVKLAKTKRKSSGRSTRKAKTTN